MKVAIETHYVAGSLDTIELPEGKTWDDVHSYYVKYYMLHVKFKDDSEMEYNLGNPDVEAKYPEATKVYAIDSQGFAVWKKELELNDDEIDRTVPRSYRPIP
jgi:hypothetical protein